MTERVHHAANIQEMLTEALEIAARQFGEARHPDHIESRRSATLELLTTAMAQIDRFGTKWAARSAAEAKAALDLDSCMPVAPLAPDGSEIHWPTLEFLLRRASTQ